VLAQVDLSNLEYCNPDKPTYVQAYRKAGLFDAYTLLSTVRPPISAVIIGILDSGIHKAHIEFSGVNIEIRHSFANAIVNNLLTHGTSVAGIVGANNLGLVQSCEGSNRTQMNGIVSGAGVPYTLSIIGQAVFLTEGGARALDEFGSAGIPIIN
jgi:hypothetical protein